MTSAFISTQRRLFLTSVARRVPKVMAELDGLRPAYQQADKASAGKLREAILLAPFTGEPIACAIHSAATATQELATLKYEVQMWAGRHHLQEPWVISAVLETLRAATGPITDWAEPLYVAHRILPFEFEFRADVVVSGDPHEWDKLQRSFELAGKRCLREWQSEYRSQCRTVGREMRETAHFDYLALYQCALKSYKEIADSELNNRGQDALNTVSRAIRRKAAFIGLSRRHPDTGS
jgi:hypothetical protein